MTGGHTRLRGQHELAGLGGEEHRAHRRNGVSAVAGAQGGEGVGRERNGWRQTDLSSTLGSLGHKAGVVSLL